jgi:transposase
MRKLTLDEKQEIVNLHFRGFTNASISKQVKCNRNTVSILVNRWKRGKFVNIKPLRRVRYHLTAQQVYKILNYFIEHPFHTYKQCIRELKLSVCCKTIGKTLSKNGLKNYVACWKPFLSMKNQIKRLRFAIKYQNWTWQWGNVVSIDEKTVQTFANCKVMVKRRVNERYNSDNIVSQEVQNTKNKVNLVGMISCAGPNMIYSVPTTLNSKQFKQLMSSKVKELIGDNTILMDNAKIHGKGITYLLQSGVKVLVDFPPKSPDLNPIENIWAVFQKNLNKKLFNITVSTKNDLLELIRDSWKEIPASFIKNCMLSMPQRLKEVIRMKGMQTKY